MATTWTNETNGTVTTAGNVLEATTLNVTGTGTANTFTATTLNSTEAVISGQGVIGGCTLTGGELTCPTVHSTNLQSDVLIVETGGTNFVKIEETSDLPSIKMLSKDGTASYLFVADNGTLRISSTQPTADADGNPV